MATIAASLWWIVRPWRRQYESRDLATLVEEAHPELNESLLSAIELTEDTEPETWKGSPMMRELLVQQTCRRVGKLDVPHSVSSVEATRWAALTAGALLVLAGPLVGTESGRLALQRYLAPWTNAARVSNLYFEVEQGDRTVARGSDVALRATPKWRMFRLAAPQTIWLNWNSAATKDTAAQSDSRRMELDPASGTYLTTVPHVFQGFDYNVSQRNARSRDYHINVVDAPSIATITLQVQPPAYTGKPRAVVDGVTGKISVFERSRLEFRLKFNKPVQSAQLVWDAVPVEEGQPDKKPPALLKLDLSDDRTSATLAFAAETGGPFEIALTDDHDLTNPPEPERILDVIPDTAPIVRLTANADVAAVRPDEVLLVPATAVDDLRVAALELHYESIGGRKGQICRA